MNKKEIAASVALGLLLVAGIAYSVAPNDMASVRPVLTENKATTKISIEPFNAVTGNRAFSQFARRSEVAAFAHYLIVITNNSADAVTALTLRWRNGEEKPMFASVDRYSSRTSIDVIPPHSQAIFWPTGNMREDIAKKYLSARSHILRVPGSANIAQWSKNAMVVDVDCVVFEHGEVFGPDVSDTVERLRVRRAVTIELTQRLRASLSQGKHVSTAIIEASSAGEYDGDGLYAFYGSLLLRQLRRMRTPIDQLVLMEDLPQLPESIYQGQLANPTRGAYEN